MDGRRERMLCGRALSVAPDLLPVAAASLPASATGWAPTVDGSEAMVVEATVSVLVSVSDGPVGGRSARYSTLPAMKAVLDSS